ncbi:MAG TPA: TIGR00303 family protein [Chloroflexota bacterium]|nr:TIGR00303 family protein [Chloroflexota bacterium]
MYRLAETASYIYPPPAQLTHTTGSRGNCLSGVIPIAQPDLLAQFIHRFRFAQPLFVCVAAHTDTSSIPGISSAGASLDLIPWTPAADLESLHYGRPTSLSTVPSNPLGPPGPALITRSALALSQMPWLPITIGLRESASLPTLEIAHAHGGRIDVEPGVADSEQLYNLGRELGSRLAHQYGGLVIGETVPGGTTTAMAVLRALGYPHRVSSSSAEDLPSIKQMTVDCAIRRARLDAGSATFNVLNQLGDPMQPFLMGMLVAAADLVPVMLAGGTQMAAVLSVTHRLEQEHDLRVPRENVLLATTPWVARDPQADLLSMLTDCGGWAGAIPELDFSGMSCRPLQSYEQLLVKEGVGAGGACVTALALESASLQELHGEIDAEYVALFAGNNV